MLHIYNSLTKQKEVFKPLVSGQVGIYVCGVTVYDNCHIGHARTYIAFDMVVRFLRYLSFNVKYVRNITDIDDKIIKRAAENNESPNTLTQRFTESMHADFKALNLLAPDSEPRATQAISGMIKLISSLLEQGSAYVGANGDVFYKVDSFKSYGSLAHKNLEDLISGTRVEVNEAKHNPLDFVLWKMSKSGEPSWASPWGPGRPGWHIECSVMAMDSLGQTFDLHGGGQDLLFPHHENERAQSEASTHQTFANIWMHTGFLQIDKEKMSKSLGNFLTIEQVLADYHPEVLRYFSLASHYRSPVDYSDVSMESAISALDRLYTALRGLPLAPPLQGTAYEAEFIEAMEDDFNTPIAFAILFDLVRDLNRHRETDLNHAGALGALLKKLGQVLGFLNLDPEFFLQHAKKLKLDAATIEQLIEARNQARQAKNWAESDKIRDKLLKAGVALEDTPTGTLWRSTDS